MGPVTENNYKTIFDRQASIVNLLKLPLIKIHSKNLIVIKTGISRMQ